MTFGERAADFVADNIGRWAFVIAQTVVIAAWMATGGFGSDLWPFIFLNLCLSLQAAYTGPVLLISSNRADATRQKMLELTEGHVALISEHTEAWERHAEEQHRLMREVHAMVLAMHIQVPHAAEGQ